MNYLLWISDLLAINKELTCFGIRCEFSIASRASLFRCPVALGWANFNEMIRVLKLSKFWTDGYQFLIFASNGGAQQDYNCNLKHNEGNFLLYIQLLSLVLSLLIL